MVVKSIETTPRYTFEIITQSGEKTSPFATAKNLQTVFFQKGDATLEINQPKRLKQIKLKAGEGLVVAPGTEYRLSTKNDFLAFRASSEINDDKPIIEIIDDGYTKKEVQIKGYKVIKNPKKVVKPWGYELWIIWTKDYHVLKQIAMKAEKRSSLQFHRKKMETNYLIEGVADIITGFVLDKDIPEDDLKKNILGVDFEIYKKRLSKNMKWTSLPGDVHRVISVKDYIAYEVSTTELDDVIRLADDSGRDSGRIHNEHLR